MKIFSNIANGVKNAFAATKSVLSDLIANVVAKIKSIASRVFNAFKKQPTVEPKPIENAVDLTQEVKKEQPSATEEQPPVQSPAAEEQAPVKAKEEAPKSNRTAYVAAAAVVAMLGTAALVALRPGMVAAMTAFSSGLVRESLSGLFASHYNETV